MAVTPFFGGREFFNICIADSATNMIFLTSSFIKSLRIDKLENARVLLIIYDFLIDLEIKKHFLA